MLLRSNCHGKKKIKFAMLFFLNGHGFCNKNCNESKKISHVPCQHIKIYVSMSVDFVSCTFAKSVRKNIFTILTLKKEWQILQKICHGNFSNILPWQLLIAILSIAITCNSYVMAPNTECCHGNYSNILPWKLLISILSITITRSTSVMAPNTEFAMATTPECCHGNYSYSICVVHSTRTLHGNLRKMN